MIDRQPRDLPLDAHLHTNLSPDSDVVIDIYAAAAVERGIAELAITDHVDFEPGAPAFGYTTFADRERVVRGAAERWGLQGVNIRFGAELTYDRTWEPDIREHLARHAYDFTIGSVHDRVASPYSHGRVQQWIQGRTLQEIVAPYFDEVEAAARSGLFDALGHLDVVKRYLHPFITKDDLATAPELYEPILRSLVESGTSLEVNTSGLRHPVGETYPSAAIVSRYRQLGGAAVTVGSDAHHGEQFGWGLADGYRYALQAGFTALTFRRGGDRVAVDIPDTAGAHSHPSQATVRAAIEPTDLTLDSTDPRGNRGITPEPPLRR